MRQHNAFRNLIRFTLLGCMLLVLYFSSGTTSDRATSKLLQDVFDSKKYFLQDSNITTLAPTASNFTPPACENPSFKEDPCKYLIDHCRKSDAAYFHYFRFFFCSPFPKWFRLVVLLLWLGCLFFLLGQAASIYFVPALSIIAAKLKMSPEVAGVTILALGNGSPDVSAVFVAVTSGNIGLAMGSLFGAGIFVTTCVVSGIAFAVPSVELSGLNFLKDIGFYTVGVSMIIGVCFSGQARVWEAAIITCYYLAYAGITIAVHYHKLAQAGKRRKNRRSTPEPVKKDFYQDDVGAAVEVLPKDLSMDDGPTLLEEPDLSSNYFTFKKWYDDMKPKSFISILAYCVTWPLLLPFVLTIPETSRWNRYSAALFPIFCPLVFFLMVYPFLEVGVNPKLALMLLIGIPLSVIVWFTTNFNRPPRYYMVFVAICFVVTVCWIYLIANELVEVLLMFGKVLEVSDILVGATVLASGNSVSDTVADILLAKQGFGKMAVAATFATPAFNTVFGLGFSLLFNTLIQRGPYPIALSIPTFTVVSLFLLLSLMSHFIVITGSKFVLRRQFGAYLLVLFFCSTTSIILSEVLWR